MRTRLIEFRERARGEIESWAYRAGTEAEIRLSAIDLLASLILGGHKTARVFIDEQGVNPTPEERAYIKREVNDASKN